MRLKACNSRMGDLISRREATSIPLPKEHGKIFKSIDDAFETGWNEALSCVNMLPPAYERKNTEPVRHGKWLITDAYPHRVYCSECYKTFALTRWEVWEDGSLPRNYCPNCGAKMDKE